MARYLLSTVRYFTLYESYHINIQIHSIGVLILCIINYNILQNAPLRFNNLSSSITANMIITNQEGRGFAMKFLSSFCAGFDNNNHSETMAGLFADNVSWHWVSEYFCVCIIILRKAILSHHVVLCDSLMATR